MCNGALGIEELNSVHACMQMNKCLKSIYQELNLPACIYVYIWADAWMLNQMYELYMNEYINIICLHELFNI